MAYRTTKQKNPHPRPRRTEVRDTAISGEDVAKVLQNLDTAKRKYRKNANEVRGFLSDIAQSLGLRCSGVSHYGTFMARNGKLFTLRVSNHNASVRNFDRCGESNVVSIVISRFRNYGLDRRGGKARVNEFFYPKRAIEETDGTPLSRIVSALTNLLQQGVYNDLTGLAEYEAYNIKGKKNKPQPVKARYIRNEMKEEMTNPWRYRIDDELKEIVAEQRGRAAGIMPALREAATVSAELGTTLRIIEDETQLPEGLEENDKAALRDGTTKAWYNTGSGDVYVFAPNCTSKEDAMADVWHEVVAHKGLRAFFGLAAYNTLCERVYRDIPPQERSRFLAYAYSTMPAETLRRMFTFPVPRSYAELTEAQRETFRTDSTVWRLVGDEYMAKRAERGDFSNTTLWQHVKEAVRRLMRRFGIDLDVNNDDIRMILSWSANNLRRNAAYIAASNGKAQGTDEGRRLRADLPATGIVPPIQATKTDYYADGVKKFEWHYSDGKLDGMQYGWNHDGSRRYTCYYKDGVRHEGQSPALKEYVEARKSAPDALVLMRFGDKALTYGQTARRLAYILGVRTTKENNVDMLAINAVDTDKCIEILSKRGIQAMVCGSPDTDRREALADTDTITQERERKVDNTRSLPHRR